MVKYAMTYIFAALAATFLICNADSARADAAKSDPAEIAEAQDSHAWRLSAGAAFRQGLKTRFSASRSQPGAVYKPGVFDDGRYGPPDGGTPEYPETTDWSGGRISQSGDDYFISFQRTESLASSETLSGNDDDGDMRGVKIDLSRDLFSVRGGFSFGVGLAYAWYDGLDAEFGGELHRTRAFTTETLRFTNLGMSPAEFAEWGLGNLPLDLTSASSSRKTVRETVGRYRVGVEGEMHQIGLGPEIAWATPGARLRLSIKPELLLNATRLESSGTFGDASETDFLWGGALSARAEAALTDSFGLFAQAGHEWIEETSVTFGETGHMKADFSGTVFTLGAVLRF